MRGLALSGMLLVNLGVMSRVSSIPLSSLAGLNWLSSFWLLALAEGKFYPLFAFLFGWGIARRQDQAGEPTASFFWPNLRRMLVLGTFGLLHAALLWEGDVLLVYALAGALLPLARRIPARMLLACACIALLFSSFLSLPGPGGQLSRAYAGWVSPLAELLRNWMLGAVDGAFEILPRLAQFGLKLLYFPAWLGNFAALILIGYRVGLTGSTFGPQQQERRSLWGLLLIALAFNAGYMITRAVPSLLPPDWVGFARSLTLSLGGPLLGLVYALGVTRAWSRARWQPVLEPLTRLGRMPLTVYLTQSCIALGIFSWSAPVGLTPALIWLLAAAILAAQVAFAQLWFSHFALGPLEAAWRRLSRP